MVEIVEYGLLVVSRGALETRGKGRKGSANLICVGRQDGFGKGFVSRKRRLENYLRSTPAQPLASVLSIVQCNLEASGHIPTTDNLHLRKRTRITLTLLIPDASPKRPAGVPSPSRKHAIVAAKRAVAPSADLLNLPTTCRSLCSTVNYS